jgi:hypothetical protein
MDHIIIGCVYSREVWSILLSKLHLQEVVLVQEENVLQWWLRNRKLVDKQVRKGFDSLFFLIGWTLLKEECVDIQWRLHNHSMLGVQDSRGGQ